MNIFFSTGSYKLCEEHSLSNVEVVPLQQWRFGVVPQGKAGRASQKLAEKGSVSPENL
jgi:hypothetical protein